MKNQEPFFLLKVKPGVELVAFLALLKETDDLQDLQSMMVRCSSYCQTISQYFHSHPVQCVAPSPKPIHSF